MPTLIMSGFILYHVCGLINCMKKTRGITESSPEFTADPHAFAAKEARYIYGWPYDALYALLAG